MKGEGFIGRLSNYQFFRETEIHVGSNTSYLVNMFWYKTLFLSLSNCMSRDVMKGIYMCPSEFIAAIKANITVE
jgi:hypothetical protein